MDYRRAPALVLLLSGCAQAAPAAQPVQRGCVDTAVSDRGSLNQHHCRSDQEMTVAHGRDMDDGYVVVCRCIRRPSTDAGR